MREPIFVVLTSIEFSAGGGTYLTFHLYRALLELGFRTTIVITPDYNACKLYRAVKIMEFECEPRTKFIQPRSTTLGYFNDRLPKTLRTFFYDKELINFIMKVKSKCRGRDIIVVYSGIFLLKGIDIAYIHYPATLALNMEPDTLNLIGTLYKGFIRYLEKNMMNNPYAILTNSSWTATKIRELYPNVSSPIHILYPPINLKPYLALWSNTNRKNYVVTIAAFSPAKKLEFIVNLARRTSKYKFIVIGSLSDYHYFNYIKKLLSKHNVSNVVLLPNAPKSLIRKILRRSRYYVHPPLAEHFGIAVAEACASGLIPIVYRDGGAWTDIVSNISNALGYKDLEEILQIMDTIDKDSSLYEELRQKSKSVAMRFSYERFKQNLHYIVNETIRRKMKHGDCVKVRE